MPVADVFKMEQPKDTTSGDTEAAIKTHEPSPSDAFVSLTPALMPLRNRKVPS